MRIDGELNCMQKFANEVEPCVEDPLHGLLSPRRGSNDLVGAHFLASDVEGQGRHAGT